MEIAVYVSTEFANENSILNKAVSNTQLEDGKKYRDIQFDKTRNTTLKELYKDGWRISSQSNMQPGWHIFFMERS